MPTASEETLLLKAQLDATWLLTHPTPSSLIDKAFDVALNAHKEQKRASGQDYITHPLTVALVTLELGLDEISVAASLCHDVVEDCDVSLEEIEADLGSDVARLVDGVTKVDRIRYRDDDEALAATTIKMLVAVAGDVRVLLIKLADRLHNMRTLSALAEPKRRKISQETIDIFVPLAHRLGLTALAGELEDIAFSHLHPDQFTALSQALSPTADHREAALTSVESALRSSLADSGIPSDIQARHKRLWSTWEKMRTTGVNLEELNDLVGLRILVDSTKDCYTVLGIVHSLYPPLPNTFNDYIALPKNNGYQSLHTTLLGPASTPIEIQIRTHRMHQVAERGIAAHFAYKEERSNRSAPPPGEELEWVVELLDHLDADVDPSRAVATSPAAFFSSLRRELAPSDLYVFTPRSEVVHLPQGASALDFAYAIHTDIGDHAAAARINDHPASLRTLLSPGDTVEIITSSSSRPRRDWIASTITQKARSRVRRATKPPSREAALKEGTGTISAALRAVGLTLDRHTIPSIIKAAHRATLDDVKLDVAYGRLSAEVLAASLLRSSQALDTQPLADSIKIAHCCSPGPDDEVSAYTARDHTTIHRADCPNFAALSVTPPSPAIPVFPAALHPEGFNIALLVVSLDRTGLLRDCTDVFAALGVGIDSSRSGISPDRLSRVVYQFTVQDTEHLEALQAALEEVPSVVSTTRVPIGTEPHPA